MSFTDLMLIVIAVAIILNAGLRLWDRRLQRKLDNR